VCIWLFVDAYPHGYKLSIQKKGVVVTTSSY
jgi:hypothetical protein